MCPSQCCKLVGACDTNGKHQFKAMKYILLNMHCELGCLACKNAAPDLVGAGVAQGTFSDSAGVTVRSQMKTSLIIAVPMAHWQLAAGSHSFPQAPNSITSKLRPFGLRFHFDPGLNVEIEATVTFLFPACD